MEAITKEQILTALSTHNMPEPKSVLIEPAIITLKYNGDQDGLIAGVSGALQIEGVNYDDPAEGTTNARAAYDRAEGETTIVLDRMDKAAYDVALAALCPDH